MLGKVIYISENIAHVKIDDKMLLSSNLINSHVIFEDNDKKILGEVIDISDDKIVVLFLGQITEDDFIGGVIKKPTFDSIVRIINDKEIDIIVGGDITDSMNIGKTPLYNKKINAKVNDLFNGHFCILGNSGSGKSFGTTRLLQNVFMSDTFSPVFSNIFMFDISGEYTNVFSKIKEKDPNLNYKVFSTNLMDSYNKLTIPLSIFSIEDLAVLLQATSPSQLPIIEKTVSFVNLFTNKTLDVGKYKNHYIAKACLNVLYSNLTNSRKRNEIFSIITDCNTSEINFNAKVQGIGYQRDFRKCFDFDSKGNFIEDLLITKFFSEFINDHLEEYKPVNSVYYTLKDLEAALNFALISEGFLQNEMIYSDAIFLKVKLHSIIISDYAKIFEFNHPCNLQQYMSYLVSTRDNGKAQIMIFNLENIDDWFARAIVKIHSRLFFEFSKILPVRASFPMHIIVEEAHRYVQKDNDEYLFGYNIFDRIAKEGRKYGVIIGLISQRIIELSETAVSQCSNFLLFKMNHPLDLEYVEKMIPNISREVIQKLKNLQPGTCIAFGKAFKIPWIIKFDLPDPNPNSNNCDVYNNWIKK